MTSWAMNRCGAACTRARISSAASSDSSGPISTSDPPEPSTSLTTSSSQPVPHALVLVRVGEHPGADVADDRVLAEVVPDHRRHERVDRLVVADTVARRVDDGHRSRAGGAGQQRVRRPGRAPARRRARRRRAGGTARPGAMRSPSRRAHTPSGIAVAGRPGARPGRPSTRPAAGARTTRSCRARPTAPRPAACRTQRGGAACCSAASRSRADGFRRPQARPRMQHRQRRGGAAPVGDRVAEARRHPQVVLEHDPFARPACAAGRSRAPSARGRPPGAMSRAPGRKPGQSLDDRRRHQAVAARSGGARRCRRERRSAPVSAAAARRRCGPSHRRTAPAAPDRAGTTAPAASPSISAMNEMPCRTRRRSKRCAASRRPSIPTIVQDGNDLAVRGTDPAVRDRPPRRAAPADIRPGSGAGPWPRSVTPSTGRASRRSPGSRRSGPRAPRWCDPHRAAAAVRSARRRRAAPRGPRTDSPTGTLVSCSPCTSRVGALVSASRCSGERSCSRAASVRGSPYSVTDAAGHPRLRLGEEGVEVATFRRGSSRRRTAAASG